VNKVILKIQNKLSRRIRKFPLIRHRIDRFYQKAIEDHLVNLPIISANDTNLIEKIKQEGLVITTLEELAISSTQYLIQIVEKLKSGQPSKSFQHSNQITIHASSEKLMEYPELFLWGLEERLLNIVENYIGLPVAYQGVYFRRDIANQLEKGSRLWHRDQEDQKMIKLIIYLNDVSENNGPFQYIHRNLTLQLAESLKYRPIYIPDKIMRETISPNNFKSCVGDSHTVIIADTANIFHRGKPPISSDRFTIFFDYTSRDYKRASYGTSILPKKYLLLLAKNLSERQKNCILW
jgi:hypothetical protein